MKHLLTIIIVLIFVAPSFGSDNERIVAYHSEIEILKNRQVIVKERIDVWSQGYAIKRGVYRDIPLNFNLPEGRIRQKLSVLSVTRNGSPEPYNVESINGGMRIYAGTKDKNISKGLHTYLFTYLLDRTVYCSENDCEVMWNVNGNQWSFYIDTLSAVIQTPDNTPITRFNAWTGEYGSFNQKKHSSKKIEPGKRVFMTQDLSAGDNLTISVAFDKGVLDPVSFSSKVAFFFRDHAVLIICITGLILTLIINYILWLRYGVDPKKGTIIPQFYPPEGWSPAEVLFLVNEGKEDKNMFVAQLLQLAVKGHVKIEKKDTNGKDEIFIIHSTDKTAKKEELTAIESGFIQILLGSEKNTTIRDKHNSKVSAAYRFLVSKIEKQQKGVYFRKNYRLIVPQYIVPFISLIAMAMASYAYEGSTWMILVSLPLMIIMNLIFMKLFYQPTKKGRLMLDHIMGLEQFITHADELRIEATNQPDMNFDYYEKNLPYAIAFGKMDEWGEKFNPKDIDQGIKASGYGVTGASLRNLGFISALTVLSSSAATPPSSAGSSGGGFSGGGFSGGGAGGGGGGGW
jgi:uncharacterized membrane protein